jgi:branched-chain amino acid transport system substrate-binding protein
MRNPLRLKDLRAIFATSRARAALVVVAALPIAIGCAEEGPVRIGAVVPRTGEASAHGESVERGMALAVAELRAAHQRGELALDYELEVRDSASDPEQAATALQQLFDDGATVAVGGVTPAETDAMGEVAEQEKRVLVSPTARARAATEAAEASRYVFRLFPSVDREGSKLASFAALELEVERSAVVAPAGDGFAADSFAQEFERNRGRVVSTVTYRDGVRTASDGGRCQRCPDGRNDDERIVEDVMKSRPQAVMVAGSGARVAGIVAGLHERGFRGAVLTTSSFASPDAMKAAGRHAEGVLLARPVFDVESDRKSVRAFVEAYRARHDQEPDLWAAYGYDAVRVLAAALEAAPSRREAWAGMRGLTDYEGVTGHLQFDETGDVAAFPRVYVVSKGAMKEIAEMAGPERRQVLQRLALAVTSDRGSARLPS